MCGEKYPVMDDAFIDMGSPPRMRGKVAHPVVPVGDQGITPAYAGKSITVMLHTSSPEDHPRVCGEKFLGKVYD